MTALENATYVPVEEVAQQLSVKVSTIRQWVHKGHIPKTTYIKVGHTYRFNLNAVVQALTAASLVELEEIEEVGEGEDI